MDHLEILGQQVLEVGQYLLRDVALCSLIGNLTSTPFSEEAPSALQILQNNIGFTPVFRLDESEERVQLNILATQTDVVDNERDDLIDVVLKIDFLVPMDKWQIEGNLRPLLIQSRIMQALKGYNIGHLGELTYKGSLMLTPDESMAGYTMTFVIENYK